MGTIEKVVKEQSSVTKMVDGLLDKGLKACRKCGSLIRKL